MRSVNDPFEDFFFCATFGAQNQRPVRVIPEGEGLHWLYHFFPLFLAQLLAHQTHHLIAIA